MQNDHDLPPSRESERDIHALILEAADVGTWEWTIPANTVRFRGVQWRLMGFASVEQDEITLEQIFARMHPEDRERVAAKLRDALEGRRDYEDEFRMVWPDGSVHWLLGKGRTDYDAEGRPVRMLGVNLDITERRRTEEALTASERDLQESREQLELAIRTSRIGFYDWNIRSDRLTFSDQMRRDWGLPEDTEGYTLDDALSHIHRDDRERVNNLIRQAVDARVPYHTEYRVVQPGGDIRWIEVTGTVTYDEDRVPVRFFGTSVDITERRALEELRVRAAQRLERFAEAMPQMAFIADAQGNITYFNRRHYEYFGIKPGESEGWRWRDASIVHPDDLERTLARWTQSLQTGEPYEIEYLLRRHDGAYRWHLGRAVPVRDGQGAVEQWFGTNTDIDDHKRNALEIDRLLKAVEYENSRFEAVMQQMPAAVIIGEAPSGRLLFSNDKMFEVWGHDLIPSSNIEEYGKWVGFHPDGTRYEGHEWPLARSIARGEVVTNEDVDILRGDGKRAVLRLSSTPIRDRAGHIMAGVVICQDVTELVEAIRSRDDFLSICSHELKTPLTTLSLLTQSSRRGIARGNPKVFSPENVHSMLEQTERQVDRLARLVNDMLDVSRIRGGKLHLEMQPVNLCDLVRGAVDKLRPLLRAAGGDPDLSLCETAWCAGDPFRLEQVVVNLLTNAARYGKGRPASIAVRTDGNSVFISVRDAGIGISKDDQERIFDRFERVVSRTELSGLGLGLYISKQIVDSHGGTISVQSEPGRGSTFEVRLPAIPPPPADVAAPPV